MATAIGALIAAPAGRQGLSRLSPSEQIVHRVRSIVHPMNNIVHRVDNVLAG